MEEGSSQEFLDDSDRSTRPGVGSELGVVLEDHSLIHDHPLVVLLRNVTYQAILEAAEMEEYPDNNSGDQEFSAGTENNERIHNNFENEPVAEVNDIEDEIEDQVPTPPTQPLAYEVQSEQNEVREVPKEEVVQPKPKERQEPPVSKYSILLGKPSTRKHKRWQEDGILTINHATGIVTVEVDGVIKQKQRSQIQLPGNIVPGETQFNFDSKVVLIDEEL